MERLPLKFGKHRGKTLPQIVMSDPDWFFWAMENKVLKDKNAIEGAIIYKRARSIRVPNNEHGKYEIEYVIHPNGGVFSEMRIVRVEDPVHPGGSRTIRRAVIDMALPRSLRGYDKSGYRLFLHNLKFILFGDSNRRMTKERCEDFFDNRDNFAL